MGLQQAEEALRNSAKIPRSRDWEVGGTEGGGTAVALI